MLRGHIQLHHRHFTRTLICSVFNPLLVIKSIQIISISIENVNRWISLHFISFNFWRLVHFDLHRHSWGWTLVERYLLNLLILLRIHYVDLFRFDQMLLAIRISRKTATSLGHFSLDSSPLLVCLVIFAILNELLVLKGRIIFNTHHS